MMLVLGLMAPDAVTLAAPVSSPAPAAAASSAPEPAREAPADEAPSPNVLAFEALGNGLLYSVSYERLLPSWNLGLRAGGSFFTYEVSRASGSGNLTLVTVPLLASYYLGPVHHKLQLGLGATVIYFAAASDSTGTRFEGDGTGLGVAATGVVGYRYLPVGRGVTFGAGFTPLLRAAKGLLPWAGVSLGYAF
jgi:hypothetical protein